MSRRTIVYILTLIYKMYRSLRATSKYLNQCQKVRWGHMASLWGEWVDYRSFHDLVVTGNGLNQASELALLGQTRQWSMVSLSQGPVMRKRFHVMAGSCETSILAVIDTRSTSKAFCTCFWIFLCFVMISLWSHLSISFRMLNWHRDTQINESPLAPVNQI